MITKQGRPITRVDKLKESEQVLFAAIERNHCKTPYIKQYKEVSFEQAKSTFRNW